MERVLVTGAGGFIGSHVVEALTTAGYPVRALLRYNSRSDRGNLEELAPAVLQEVEVVQGDLRDADSVRRAVSDCGYVLHLGALIAIPYSYVNPTEFVEVNALGTTHVLSACRDSRALQRVIVTSTSEVYGSARSVPMDESHPLQGQSPYSASKIAADHIAESFSRAFQLPVGILRPFNTYGPRQSMRAIIPTIILQLLSRDRVELGSLTPRRDLTFVEDTVQGFVRMMTCEIPYGAPINLGSGADISIGELFEKLKALVGADVELIHDAGRVRPERSEVDHLRADATLATQVLGWRPTVSLQVGLERTIAWVRQRLDRYRASEYHV